MTQWEAWGGGASKEVVLEEDREDDTGEFFYVSWASVAESGGGFLAYSTGVGDRVASKRASDREGELV